MAWIVVQGTGLGAQELGVTGGFGRAFWSGPEAGGAWGVTHLALAIQSPVGTRGSLRLEAGGGPFTADLGSLGWFDQETTLRLFRFQLSGIARWRPGPTRARGAPFVEGGLGYWIRTACDVDFEGGPGFLGGETAGCGSAGAEGAEDVLPLVPRGSGAVAILGAGARRGPWSLGMRYEYAGRDLLRGPRGRLGADVLQLVLEWTFRRPL